MTDEVKYGTSRPDDGLTDRMTPPWWSETRRQELQEFFVDYLGKSTCPITMGIRTKCETREIQPEWYVRRVHGGYRLEQPATGSHVDIEGDILDPELLEKWAQEETPLIVEITHGP